MVALRPAVASFHKVNVCTVLRAWTNAIASSCPAPPWSSSPRIGTCAPPIPCHVPVSPGRVCTTTVPAPAAAPSVVGVATATGKPQPPKSTVVCPDGVNSVLTADAMANSLWCAVYGTTISCSGAEKLAAIPVACVRSTRLPYAVSDTGPAVIVQPAGANRNVAASGTWLLDAVPSAPSPGAGAGAAGGAVSSSSVAVVATGICSARPDTVAAWSSVNVPRWIAMPVQPPAGAPGAIACDAIHTLPAPSGYDVPGLTSPSGTSTSRNGALWPCRVTLTWTTIR